MSMNKGEKINSLLKAHPPGVVLVSSWLGKQGYSLGLLNKYKKSQWFESFGQGALIRHGDQVDYLGGIYALQAQLGLSVHPAAKTALSLQGRTQYLELAKQSVQLLGAKNERLPLWFKNKDWEVDVVHKTTSFLPPKLGLVDIEHKTFSVQVSAPARAIMECLYVASSAPLLLEAYELMEGLNNLRPAKVQALLEACSSLKVKRLFLYMAEKAEHEWFSYLALENIDLGAGKRSIVSDGVYIPKYQIAVPKELERGV